MTNFKNKQDLIDIYLRNGCFYVIKTGLFKKYKTWRVSPCLPHLMDEQSSVNIDGPLDLILAKYMEAPR